ncbi:hypothetical protein MAH1_22640 [Sessilibacter sp. MAH1]
MSKKVSDLAKAREDKREKTGWSLEEVKNKAACDFKKYRKISQESHEPDGFHSGDMKKFLDGSDDDDQEK